MQGSAPRSQQITLSALQARARQARDETTREKHRLLAQAWKVQQGDALDKVLQKISLAREAMLSNTISAADLGKNEATLLRLSFQTVDLRHLLQNELHASGQRSPDPYPKLRSLGPPSFRDIETWLRQDLKIKELEPSSFDWLVKLDRWVHRHSHAYWWLRWSLRRPPLPKAISDFFNECKQRKLNPRFEPYQHREDRGIALVVTSKR